MALSREMSELILMLESRPWKSQYEPRLREVIDSMGLALDDPSGARKGAVPDDFIRGYRAALRWALSWPEEQVREAIAMTQEEKVLAEREEEYETRARTGYTYPFAETVDARAE